MTPELEAEIRAGEAAATFGPWGWFGTPKYPMLATHTGGRVYIMMPQRSGMQGATIAFQNRGRTPGERIENAEAYAVKERSYRENLDGYRDGIDHPDAKFIARSRAWVPALLAEIDELRARLAEKH